MWTKIFDCGIECSKYEDEVKRLNKEYKYLPTKEFGGMYECFSKIVYI